MQFQKNVEPRHPGNNKCWRMELGLNMCDCRPSNDTTTNVCSDFGTGS